MEIKLLRTFCAVAVHGHFHEAARRLFLAQPTVTKHVRQLEESLGCALFERNGKQVRLTPVGERFFPVASRLLEQADAALASVESWKQGYQSKLKIAASPIAARSFLPLVLRRFAQDHPEVEISVLVAESADIPALVGSGACDLGLSRSAANDIKLRSVVLFEDPVLMIAPPQGGDLDSPIENWERLLAIYPVLSHNHPGYWEPLLAGLEKRGVHYRLMRVSQIDITLRFVQAGLGVSFLPRSAVWLSVLNNQVQNVPAPDLGLPMTAAYLIAPQTPQPSPAAARFIELLYGVQLEPEFA